MTLISLLCTGLDATLPAPEPRVARGLQPEQPVRGQEVEINCLDQNRWEDEGLPFWSTGLGDQLFTLKDGLA